MQAVEQIGIVDAYGDKVIPWLDPVRPELG
jgi:hypothetical protein